MNLSYVGMSTRHLGVKAREHLNLADQHKNSAIKDHLMFRDVCCETCKAAMTEAFLKWKGGPKPMTRFSSSTTKDGSGLARNFKRGGA